MRRCKGSCRQAAAAAVQLAAPATAACRWERGTAGCSLWAAVGDEQQPLMQLGHKSNSRISGTAWAQGTPVNTTARLGPASNTRTVRCAPTCRAGSLMWCWMLMCSTASPRGPTATPTWPTWRAWSSRVSAAPSFAAVQRGGDQSCAWLACIRPCHPLKGRPAEIACVQQHSSSAAPICK